MKNHYSRISTLQENLEVPSQVPSPCDGNDSPRYSTPVMYDTQSEHQDFDLQSFKDRDSVSNINLSFLK